MNSNNITDTDSRLLSNLNKLNEDFYRSQNIETQIENAKTESILCTGKILKFYPSLNKALVQLDYNNKKVLCKNLMLCSGDILVLYTPTGDATYCDDLHEPCLIPRAKIDCIVAPVNSGDSEYVMLGYYLHDELLHMNPSRQGNLKILAQGGINEYSLKFGIDGLSIVSNGEISTSALDTVGNEIEKTEYYSKAEVDALLDELREELNPLSDDESEDTVNST